MSPDSKEPSRTALVGVATQLEVGEEDEVVVAIDDSMLEDVVVDSVLEDVVVGISVLLTDVDDSEDSEMVLVASELDDEVIDGVEELLDEMDGVPLQFPKPAWQPVAQ